MVLLACIIQFTLFSKTLGYASSITSDYYYFSSAMTVKAYSSLINGSAGMQYLNLSAVPDNLFISHYNGTYVVNYAGGYVYAVVR